MPPEPGIVVWKRQRKTWRSSSAVGGPMGTTRTWRGSMLAVKSTNRAALAGGVESFEQNDQPWSNDVVVEQSGREEAQLRQTMLGRRDTILGLRLFHRQRKIDLVDSICHKDCRSGFTSAK